jgi:hypothetical protein
VISISLLGNLFLLVLGYNGKTVQSLENITMTKLPKAHRTHLLRRILKWMFLCALLLCLICSVLLWKGTLQRYLITYVLEGALNTRVEVASVTFRDDPHIDRLALYDGVGLAAVQPAVTLDDLNLVYTFNPQDGRYVRELTIHRLDVVLDGTTPEDTNFDFITDFLNAPATDIDPLPFLPQKLLLQDVGLDFAMPSWSTQVGGIAARAEVGGMDQATVAITGNPTHVSWSLPGLEDLPHDVSGNLDLQLTLAGPVMMASGRITLPELADLEGLLRVEDLEDGQSLDMLIDQASLQSNLWGNIASDLLPLQVHFDMFQLQNTHIEGLYSAGHLSEIVLQLSAVAEALRIGDVAQPWYEGNLHITAEGGLGKEPELSSVITLNDAQSIALNARGTMEDNTFQMRIEEWNRAQIRAITPRAFYSALDLVPGLTGISTHLDGHIAEEAYTVHAEVNPHSVSGKTLRIQADATGQLSGASGFLEEGRGLFTFGEGKVTLVGRAESLEDLSGKVTLEAVNPRAWLENWMDESPLAGLDSQLNGELLFASSTAETYELSTSLSLSDIHVKEMDLPENTTLRLTSAASVSKDLNLFKGDTLEMKLNDDAIVTLHDWNAGLAPFSVGANMDGNVDLEAVAPLLGMDDLRGLVSFQAPITMDNSSHLHGDLTMTLEDLGWGDLSLPYGASMSVTAPFDVTLNESVLAIPQLQAKLGDDTTLTLSKAKLSMAAETDLPLGSVAALDLKTGFAPLIAKGFLDNKTKGFARLEADSLRLEPQGLLGNFTFQLDASVLALAESLADIRDLTAKGSVQCTPEWSGSGDFEAASLIAGGSTLRALQGKMAVLGDLLRVEPCEAELFGGRVEIVVDVEPLSEAFPVRLTAKIIDIDLASFTTEFQPPSLLLAGKVNGDIMILFENNSLKDVKIDLKATDHVTVNRAIIEDMIRSQQFEGLSSRAVDKMVEKFLGNSDPVPFDEAHLDLGFEEGRFVGLTSLRSARPHINLDVRADPKALVSLMKAQQQMQLKELD